MPKHPAHALARLSTARVLGAGDDGRITTTIGPEFGRDLTRLQVRLDGGRILA